MPALQASLSMTADVLYSNVLFYSNVLLYLPSTIRSRVDRRRLSTANSNLTPLLSCLRKRFLHVCVEKVCHVAEAGDKALTFSSVTTLGAS